MSLISYSPGLGLFSIGRRLIGCGLIGLCLSQCSLSLENPDEDARNKLAKVLPATMSVLEGRWEVDSTYTSEDSKATGLRGISNMQLEIFADSTITAVDTLRLVFPGKVIGRIRISSDTLFILPFGRDSSTLADTFLVKVRFLGNRLQLDHPVDQRYTFFHKIKPVEFDLQDSLLSDSLWLHKSRRVNAESLHVEPLLHDFTYLRFSSGSLHRDWRRNGIFRTDSGSLTKEGRIWTWTTSAGSQEFMTDMVSKDTLRIWPLVAGKLDSGFDTYTRATRRHPLDLDIRSLIGHMRSDSIKTQVSRIENHYGRFFDLEFAEDHSVKTETNMKNMPIFKSWNLDTGLILLAGPSGAKARFKLDTTLSNTVMLSTDSGAVFSAHTEIFQTKVNSERFADHPLDRFDQASYAHIRLGSDTLRFYFTVNFLKGNPDDHEIQHLDSLNNWWLTFRINPSQESFQSSQTGFRYVMEGRTSALGAFTCKALAASNMVIRLTSTADPTMAQGLIQGPCHVLTSEIAPADSNLNLDGSFRLKRRNNYVRQSSLWSL